jgi:hypothetical protein
MIREKFSKKYLTGLAIAGVAVALFFHGTGLLTSSYADTRTSVAVGPFFQLPGRSVIVTGDGFAPNANATIYVKNVVARVETQKAGEPTVTVTFPDQIVVGKTETAADGSLEWALGVPRDEVKVIERWINNSTGQEEVLKTVTTTYRFQGTVKVTVTDQFGNSASDELLIIRWINESPF